MMVVKYHFMSARVPMIKRQTIACGNEDVGNQKPAALVERI